MFWSPHSIPIFCCILLLVVLIFIRFFSKAPLLHVFELINLGGREDDTVSIYLKHGLVGDEPQAFV